MGDKGKSPSSERSRRNKADACLEREEVKRTDIVGSAEGAVRLWTPRMNGMGVVSVNKGK